MYLKAMSLFTATVLAVAAPDPSPAPEPALVAELFKRQVTASAPGFGVTANDGTACVNLGPISGCLAPSSTSIGIPGGAATLNTDGGSVLLSSTFTLTTDGSVLVVVSTTRVGINTTRSPSRATVTAVTGSDSETLATVTTTSGGSGGTSSDGVPVATPVEGGAGQKRVMGAAAAGVAVGGLFVRLL